MKQQIVLVARLCLLAVLMLAGCQGGPSPTPTASAGKEMSQQALESALATRFVNDPTGLCEWEVWGEAGQEIYLWAICQSAKGAGCSAPAVVRVAQDESSVWRIREVKMPRDGTLYGEDVRVLFPSDVQRRILAHNYDTNAAWARIEARRDRINRQAIRVTLGIFSGRPDPTWMLTPAQTIELQQRLAALPPTDQPFDDVEWFPSGYHGLTLLLPAAKGQPSQLVEAYKGVVRVEAEGQVTLLADADHDLERWLLTGGSGDIWSELVGTILEELDQGAETPSLVTGIPFTVCQSSEIWTRPGEDDQAAQVWDASRRQGIPREMLWWKFQQSFYRYGGGNSEAFDAWPELGLWTARDPYICKGDRIGGIITGREIELWLLLHRVVAVQRQGDVYTVTVEPTAAGYQIVRLPGPGPVTPINVRSPLVTATLRFVDTEGREIDHLPKSPPWADQVLISRTVVTVTGTVVDNALSAQTVTLEDANGATWCLPWMDATIVRRADGTPAQFRDIARGMALDVAGFRRTQATTPNTLSAVRVIILDPTPAP